MLGWGQIRKIRVGAVARRSSGNDAPDLLGYSELFNPKQGTSFPLKNSAMVANNDRYVETE